MNTTKPVALITGGSRGIGLGCALALAREGYDLAIAGRRPESDCREALDSLRAAGAGVIYAVCNVADRAAREALMAAVRTHYGRLNVLVNNAGMAPRERRDILEADEASFEELLRVNLMGPYFLTQAAAKWMIAQREADAAFRGCIINVSSISATAVSLNRGEYCVSKAGVSMATQLWAARLAGYGLPVYEIRPGIIATDMTAGVRERYDKLIADGLVPERRWGTPGDIGRTVAALARGDLAYATGQVINMDGGLSIPRL
ncbi:MAG: 3-ketoacyl-ACP reductase [Lentisphaerae bacterium]|jgi:NAD(P)-dependent dehydrogenase (short-subunit alcohol dehydrogenase family)|nr:3-ketoacyl-ACP reductase [Lentisphaerota bacterium]